jgi:hypothetical protein
MKVVASERIMNVETDTNSQKQRELSLCDLRDHAVVVVYYSKGR